MTGKHPPITGGRTLADEMRDDLAQCEDRVVQIGAGADGLALLRLIDRVADELERLEARGVDLRAERARLEHVLGQLERHKRKLVAEMGGALAAGRPAEARWWWHLDERVAADRRRSLKRVVTVTLAGLVLLALVYVLYDRFIAPPPHIRQASAHYFDGEQTASEGDLPGAIEQFEAAVTLDPERSDAYVWLGVLYEAMGDVDRAEINFERARAFLKDDDGGETYFLFQRGALYLAFNDIDAAEQDAMTAIEAAPDRPEGFFLLGNVAERVGDLQMAAAAFQQTAALAEAAGEDALRATALMRFATLSEMLMTMPEQKD